jgi:hypothetical protein
VGHAVTRSGERERWDLPRQHRQAHTHTNGHEVSQGDEVPQVVKVTVAEEELGTLQKRRLVLGPRWVLGRELTLRTCCSRQRCLKF